jgi:shikimate dehydrogenase
MHEHEADVQGLRTTYRLIDVDQLGLAPEHLPELLTAAERMGFCGLNITHPFKQSVIPHLSWLSDDARTLGAVNTVVLRSGRRLGHNTDWWGFAESFRRGLPDAPLQRVVQLGAGGAGAAVAYALLTLGTAHLTVYDVDAVRAEALARKLGTHFGPSRIAAGADLPRDMAAADGLAHATPTGMAKHPGLPLPQALLRAGMWVAEIVYFPLATELLCVARELGCRTLDGSGMAVYQATKAFHLFTGREANAERMLRRFEEMGR